MFSSIRRLKQIATRRKFKKLVQSFDDQIEEARAKHQPVKHLQKAKSEFVLQCLERRA